MRGKRLGLGVVLAVAAAVAAVAGASSAASADAAGTYVVLYKGTSVPADAATTIQAAGGILAQSYDRIGVAIARSSSATFASTLAKNSNVEGVSNTANFATKVTEEVEAAPAVALNGPWGDPLSVNQWDMPQIHVPEAHAITKGSASVVVGDLDTGLDWTHPDLAANVDFSKSASCESGVPDQSPAAWMDHNGHGTHTAGTIAADDNGIGIVGVAPDVKIAGIKTSNDDGYFFPEAVVCAFMWVADHGIDVTNNSYFADPWLFNCLNDPEQRAIWKAEQRAIRYAMTKGVTVVAAAGNENIDLSKQNIDEISPDFPPGEAERREVTNACKVVPVEVPGVIGVTADGYNLQKAYYSSYGVGVADVTAPGGDRRFQIPPTGNGRVLSTYLGGAYVYLQGTSMASPHAAGVAALAISAHGKMSPGAIQAIVENTADAMDCPPNPFNPGPPFDFLAICVGGAGYNGFYGHGQVNALAAVS
jgi:lantibiotic leader peptide-processing serine protease